MSQSLKLRHRLSPKKEKNTEHFPLQRATVSQPMTRTLAASQWWASYLSVSFAGCTVSNLKLPSKKNQADCFLWLGRIPSCRDDFPSQGSSGFFEDLFFPAEVSVVKAASISRISQWYGPAFFSVCGRQIPGLRVVNSVGRHFGTLQIGTLLDTRWTYHEVPTDTQRAPQKPWKTMGKGDQHRSCPI